MRVLLVEDDSSVARFVQKGLQEEGYAVDVAADGEKGLWLHKANDYDLLIVDLMLPKLDGFELVRRIRQHDTRTPILVLTARAAIQDRVQGLESGADDYLIKPFAFVELVAPGCGYFCGGARWIVASHCGVLIWCSTRVLELSSAMVSASLSPASSTPYWSFYCAIEDKSLHVLRSWNTSGMYTST